MAKTKIGTKLLADNSISTAKLQNSSVTRSKIQSGSIQVGHMDLFQAPSTHVELLDNDVLIISASKGKNGGMKTILFSALKAGVSASNAAVGDPGKLQFHAPGGTNAMGAVKHFISDGTDLTASNGGVLHFAAAGASGSHGSIQADSATSLTITADTTLKFKIDGSNELELNASSLKPSSNGGLDLGSTSNLYQNVYANSFSGSGTSTFHKIDADQIDAARVDVTHTISGSFAQINTLNAHDVNLGNATITKITGSGTAAFHKMDTDLAAIDRVQSLVVTGSGLASIHKLDVDKATIDRVVLVNMTGSATAQLHQVTSDKGTFGTVVATNLTSSGTSQFHNVQASVVTGTVGKFNKLTVDTLNAFVYKSTVTTKEHFEVEDKQIIAAVSASAGVATEGAGLQIGGAAGSGSAGIASIVLGDAGGGAGTDLLFKIGSTQAASITATGARKSGAASFGVTGTLSASIGIFHEIDVNKTLKASSFSGSKGEFHLVTGSNVEAHVLTANRGAFRTLSGSTATFQSVSASAASFHTLGGANGIKRASIATISGSSATYTTVSGTTVQVHQLEATRLNVKDLDVSSVTGSGTSTFHNLQVTTQLSGASLQAHTIDVDKLTVNDIQSTDIIHAVNLHDDIVRTTTGNGGLNFANGVLSVGTRRQIFSRTSVANRSAAPTDLSSDGLFTTASLIVDSLGRKTIMLSGSEMVYLNGVLLIPAPAGQVPPVDGDYTINHSATPTTIKLHETLAMDADDILVVSFLSGTVTPA